MGSFLALFKKILRYTAIVLAAVMAVTFAVSNRRSVALDLFPFGYEMSLPLFLLIFLSFMLGSLAGNLSSLLSRLSAFRSYRRDMERIAALENELSALKSAPNPPRPSPPAPLTGGDG